MNNSTILVLKKLFERDLLKLKTEILAYQSEENLWIVDHNITNCSGNLCLHLIGNLNTFIAAEFGKTGYIRKRDLEFSAKNIPRTSLIEMIDQTLIDLNKSLDQLTDLQLKEPYPKKVFGQATSTEFMLIHLTTHLTYHLGQVNYHRRLLDK